MNCIDLFVERQKQNATRTAIWLPNGKQVSFSELYELGSRMQGELIRMGLKPGDSVLLFDLLSPRLYGVIVALLSLGVTVLFVEPWMPISRIDKVIRAIKPRFFISNLMGKVWGLRVASIRDIPNWVSPARLSKASGTAPLQIESVEGNRPGIITFTTGTTGSPKGVVRHQSYLVDQYKVFSDALEIEKYQGPDLCIFANFVLANLAAGKGSLIIPSSWKKSDLAKLNDLPTDLRPQSMTCGPAFLLKLMEAGSAKTLESIHIGGALTDCAIFEKGFAHWPNTHWSHLYGSSEAEPVALADAHVAVKESQKRGFYQALFVGKPIPQIQSSLEETGLWVTGPHVCPRYVGNEEENKIHKRVDSNGKVWHSMGDRILSDETGWWYAGRAQQPHEDFLLEQKVYTFLNRSTAFIHREPNGERVLFGKGVEERSGELRKAFPEIATYRNTQIVRDKRHKARIDRVSSRKKS